MKDRYSFLGSSKWISGLDRFDCPATGYNLPAPNCARFPRAYADSGLLLVQAQVLAAIRRRHGVRLAKVRKALDYVRHQFRVERPPINQAFQTDGLDPFVECDGELINASREEGSSDQAVYVHSRTLASRSIRFRYPPVISFIAPCQPALPGAFVTQPWIAASLPRRVLFYFALSTQPSAMQSSFRSPGACRRRGPAADR